jgi:tetratricopeptide (TPR) repeat protein
MASEAFQRGCSLFVDEDFEEALGAFSQAIDLAGPASKETAEYYVKRSACHAKLQHHTDAVADANAALAIDPQNPRALLRKGYEHAFYLDFYQFNRLKNIQLIAAAIQYCVLRLGRVRGRQGGLPGGTCRGARQQRLQDLAPQVRGRACW